MIFSFHTKKVYFFGIPKRIRPTLKGYFKYVYWHFHQNNNILQLCNGIQKMSKCFQNIKLNMSSVWILLVVSSDTDFAKIISASRYIRKEFWEKVLLTSLAAKIFRSPKSLICYHDQELLSLFEDFLNWVNKLSIKLCKSLSNTSSENMEESTWNMKRVTVWN